MDMKIDIQLQFYVVICRRTIVNDNETFIFFCKYMINIRYLLQSVCDMCLCVIPELYTQWLFLVWHR